MKLQLIHLLLLFCIIKFLSSYTDSKFLAMCTVLCICLYYLYSSEKISFNIKLFENVTKDQSFEEKLRRLNTVINELTIFSFNKELKHVIIYKVQNYTENLAIIYYNKVQHCTYYIDILSEKKYDILNTARSYIITAMHLETYASLEKELLDFEKLLDDVLNDVIIKCPKYNNKQIMPASNYDHKHSFQQY